MWRWFADKFDQRENRRYEKILSAANEVVWSVYATAIRAANSNKVPSPAPLPYLDDLDSPEAIPRDDPPPSLRPDRPRDRPPDSYDEGLHLMLSKLPIPAVGLPTDISNAPWKLALLGHEVGHHLQYDLLPGRALIESVEEAVAAAAGGEARGDDWRSWSRELFADLAGLVMLGPASLIALLPLELGTETYMLDRERGRYPAPWVRLAAIRAMAGELGLTIDDPAPPLGATAQPTPLGLAIRVAVEADLGLVPGVAKALTAYCVAGKRTLAELSSFSALDYTPGGRVSTYARQLKTGHGMNSRGLLQIRALVSAGMLAWQQIGGIGDPDSRAQAWQALGNALIDRIIVSAELTKRGPEEPGGGPVTVDEELAGILTRGFIR